MQSYLDEGEPKGMHYYWKTEYASELSDDLLATTRDLYAECRAAWKRLPFSTGGNYVNFQTDDEDEQRVRAAYGANFDRLATIKRMYDPANLFRSNRNVQAQPSS